MRFMDAFTRHPGGSATGGRFASRRYGNSRVALPAAAPGPQLAGSPILAAINAAKASILRGETASAAVDTEAFSEVDELDGAAIRAFFAENAAETDSALLVAELAPVVAALNDADITGPANVVNPVRPHRYAADIDWSQDSPGEMMSQTAPRELE